MLFFFLCAVHPPDITCIHCVVPPLRSSCLGKGGGRRDVSLHLWRRACLPVVRRQCGLAAGHDIVDVEGEGGGARRDVDLRRRLRRRIGRSEEQTSELQSLMRISYAVFCLKKKTNRTITNYTIRHANTSLLQQSIHNMTTQHTYQK